MVVLFKRADRFYLKIPHPVTGKPKYKSLGPKVKSREQAEQIRKAVEASLRTQTLDHLVSESHSAPSTISELCDLYSEFAASYYRREDGSQTSEVNLMTFVIRRWKTVCPNLAIVDFSPRVFKFVRDFMIEEGKQTRESINESMNRIKRILKWGVENQFVSPEILAAVQAVAPLKRGRTSAREGRRVVPVSLTDVRKTQERLHPILAAMVELQLLTGARPGEIVSLQPRDIDTTDEIWVANLSQHKNRWRGQDRFLYFGKKAQDVLRPFLLRPAESYLFDPREAMASRAQLKMCHRRPNQKSNPRKTDRTLGDHYTTESYRRAITRACKAAGVEPWHPNQLRHARATEIRRLYGLEGAQVYLGHATADVTQVYAEVDREKALRIAREIG